jgi:hypothetical protein
MQQFFILKTPSGQVYTGKAGGAWVSRDAFEAFAFADRAEAERKAALFNRMSAVHGCAFAVEADQ